MFDYKQCVEGLRRELGPSGFDLFGVGRVGICNEAVPAAWHLPELCTSNDTVIVIGHGRAIWAPFVRALAGDAGLRNGRDPFDRWTATRIIAAVRAVMPAGVAWELRHVWEGPPRQVAMQAVAVQCGLAAKGPAGLVVDPVRGPWMAFRAVLIVGLNGPEIIPEVVSPCATCDARPCVVALESATRMQQGVGVSGARPGAGLEPSHAARVVPLWRAWLGVRDACPAGRSARYSEPQIRYHYARDPRALEEET